MRSRLSALFIGILLSGLLPLRPQEQPDFSSDFKLRVSVNLVQIDATVTDSHDRAVPDLTSDDFRVLLDGKPQAIKICNYITAGAAAPLPSIARSTAPAQVSKKQQAALPPMPSAPLKREQVRRTVVLFVNDFAISAQSLPAIRNGIRRFVTDHVQPGDLAAIVRASAGLGALQDFTNDKAMLLAAADQVRWHPWGMNGRMEAYESMEKTAYTGSGPYTVDSNEERIAQEKQGAIEMIASLTRLIHAMADLPGRKSIVVLSDTIPLTTSDDVDPMATKVGGGVKVGGEARVTGSGAFIGSILGGMRRLVDESARAGVVLYDIDTRGLSSLTANASDRLALPGEGTNPEPTGGGNVSNTVETAAQPNEDHTQILMQQNLQFRRDDHILGQWGGLFLTSQTGGFMVTESNFIDDSLKRIMGDQSGYYLLAFNPPEEMLAPGPDGLPVYHRLKVEVLKPGLKVRCHQGFFGLADEERAPVSTHPELQLAAALESPFQTSAVRLRVSGAFLNARKNSSILRATVVIDGRDLEFSGPPINRSAVLHLLVRAYSVAGEALPGSFDQVLRVNVNEEGYERALKYGLIYTTLVPIDKPGPYQIRAACRDENNGKLGNASDFLIVPRIGGRRMVLSGIMFQNSAGKEDTVVPALAPLTHSPGQTVEFLFQVVNSPGAPALKTKSLTMKTRLFRDGVQISESASLPIDTDEKKPGSRFFSRGAIQLPSRLDPGEYFLRVEVVNPLAPPKSNTAWQWARLWVLPAQP